MSKSLITNLRKLGRRKYRKQNRQFVAEGLRTVRQIIANSSIVIDYLVFDESTHLMDDITYSGLDSTVQRIGISHKEFMELSDTDTPQGIMAICRMPQSTELSAFHNKEGCIIALNRIQDPGNAGSILRSAAWFGASGILCDDGTVDIYHPKVVRSTAGAMGTIAQWEGDLETALSELESHQWNIYLLDAGEQSVSLKEVKPSPKSILVIGNEATGLDKALLKDHRSLIKIPGEGFSPDVESLNASIALSIALYEFVRYKDHMTK
ncbi:MAG: RNA methyltransferase [Balneolales bacterium]